jgi:hypothetical protein
VRVAQAAAEELEELDRAAWRQPVRVADHEHRRRVDAARLVEPVVIALHQRRELGHERLARAEALVRELDAVHGGEAGGGDGGCLAAHGWLLSTVGSGPARVATMERRPLRTLIGQPSPPCVSR